MFRNLFSILFRPVTTVERLLAERNFPHSWGATWFLVGINFLLLFLLGVFLSREFNDVMAMIPMAGADEEFAADMIGWGVLVSFGIFGLIAIPIVYVLSRFIFSWMVLLGVKVSASSLYPRDPEVRRENVALLRLVQPYTLWIYTLASIISMLFLPFVLDISGLVEAIQVSEMSGDEVPGDVLQSMMAVVLWSMLSNLLQLGLFIYMIVVRTMAIKRIYSISTSQAFWGPFLIYFLLYFVLFVLYIVFILVVNILAGPTGTGPNML